MQELSVLCLTRAKYIKMNKIAKFSIIEAGAYPGGLGGLEPPKFSEVLGKKEKSIRFP